MGWDEEPVKEEPKVRKTNPDGTVNKNVVQSKNARAMVDRMKETEADSTSGSEAWRKTERNYIVKQNKKRKEDQASAADRQRKVKNRRAKADAGKATVHFSKYVDHVRVQKDKAKKKLKAQTKRSYYDDDVKGKS